MIDTTLLKNLEAVLSTVVASDEHLDSNEIRGLFFAQTITPNKGNLPDWLAALFYGERPELNDSQISALNSAAGAVYDAYNQLFIANTLAFPFDLDALDVDSAEAAYSWCRGFYMGLSINEIFWLGFKGEKIKNNKELEAVRNSAKLLTGVVTQDFSEFDSVKLAEIKAFIIEQGQQPTDEIIAATLFNNLPTAIKTLQLYGTKLIFANVPKTNKSAAPKLGRNEPCHCGSGKKYKKCCG